MRRKSWAAQSKADVAEMVCAVEKMLVGDWVWKTDGWLEGYLEGALAAVREEAIEECARLTGVAQVALEPEAGRVERTRAACAAAILALLEPGDEGEGDHGG